ncbi:MAG: rsmA [Candidatus Midichloriaceae bacterium]|jgi:16S rRNA (adenine1518-N6/adenine1519-N6)-dimethyltransferase|nr:rsmA [Candidatus Midichloriaceae bacterium]
MATEYLKTLPKTSELIRIYNLETNKKLGQNFLLDDSITDQILNHLPNLSDKTILEVGPGPGGLTRSILFKEPKKLYAVEYDHNCIPILQLIEKETDGVLKVIQADALTFDEATIEGKISIIANLPYNIGSSLVLKWLANIDKFEFIAVMLQKEVAERICAEPSTKSYGRLSIAAQSVADVDIMLEVDPHHFYPPPKVTSTVVRLIPKKDRIPLDSKILEKVTAAAFGLKRKKIKTSMKSIISAEDLALLNIDSNKRAEDLAVAEYIKITQFLMARK